MLHCLRYATLLYHSTPSTPHPLGIARDGSCVSHPNFNAYVCRTLKHRLLVLESMDEDTETRRVSPVAVLTNGSHPYLHLWLSY